MISALIIKELKYYLEFLKFAANICGIYKIPFLRGNCQIPQEIALKNELKKQIRSDIDSVIIFKSRQEKWLDKEFWGKQDDNMSNII